MQIPLLTLSANTHTHTHTHTHTSKREKDAAKKKGAPLGQLDLSAVSEINTWQGTDQENLHCIRLVSPARTLLLCAYSGADFIRWLVALQESCGELDEAAPSAFASDAPETREGAGAGAGAGAGGEGETAAITGTRSFGMRAGSQRGDTIPDGEELDAMFRALMEEVRVCVCVAQPCHCCSPFRPPSP